MIRFKPALLLPVAAALTLAGCDSVGTREGTGIGVGAATGAVIGGLVTGRPAGAAVGGVLGGIAGGAIGSELDRQAGELRQSFDNGQIDVVNTGSSLVVTMPDDILFATDSAALTPALRGDLIALADHLQRYPNSRVQVVGHTDSTGSPEYNLNLSRMRAQAVASVLTANGVSSSRVSAFGRGEDEPVATNLTAEGRAENRRVEITIIPN